MLFSTTVLLNVMDMPFTFLTIYNVIRNQYFYLGETVLVEVKRVRVTLTSYLNGLGLP